MSKRILTIVATMIVILLVSIGTNFFVWNYCSDKVQKAEEKVPALQDSIIKLKTQVAKTTGQLEGKDELAEELKQGKNKAEEETKKAQAELDAQKRRNEELQGQNEQLSKENQIHQTQEKKKQDSGNANSEKRVTSDGNYKYPRQVNTLTNWINSMENGMQITENSMKQLFGELDKNQDAKGIVQTIKKAIAAKRKDNQKAQLNYLKLALQELKKINKS